MMDRRVRILDKTFEQTFSPEEIRKRVGEAAVAVSRDLRGKDPVFVCILNGSFVFAADLLRSLDFPARVSFVKMASYCGTASTGRVDELIGLSEDLEGKTVVIVEDIIDTGLTMQRMLRLLAGYHPAEVHIAALFLKPGNLKVDLQVDYPLFCIPNDFIVGYGLDYESYGRNLPGIYTLTNE